MIALAWERVNLSRKIVVEAWLKEEFGPSTLTTWYIDQDYDLQSLVLNDAISVMYYLKWA